MNPNYPVSDIDWVVHACRADEPLPPGDLRRHDFSALRGCDVLTELAVILSARRAEGTYHHRILCGHRGSGKSTELLALKQWADSRGFLTVWVEVDLYYGLAELQFSDMYLLAAESVEREMRAAGLALPGEKLERVARWFAEVTHEDFDAVKLEVMAEAGAEVGGLFPLLLGRLFARFSAGVKSGSERHRRIRSALRQSPNTLIDMTNDLLHEADAALHAAGRPRGLLLFFDNLDRFEPEAIDALLLKSSSLIRPLACHAIFTMPINLHYGPGSPYQDSYGGPATILPMLALRRCNLPWAATVAESEFIESNVDELVRALGRRIDVAALFQGHPEDVRLLVKMSGGCVRELLHLVNLAYQKSFVSLAEPLTHLTTRGVRRAIDQYRGDLSEGLQEDEFRRLAAVARRDPGSDILDAPLLQLLARRIAFRYSDGADRWVDVHPLFLETEGFQREFARRDA